MRTLSNSTSTNNMLLSSREKEVIHFLAYEYSTKEIARELYVSFETIKTHRKNIQKKLRAKNVAGIIRVAFENQILPLQQGPTLLLQQA